MAQRKKEEEVHDAEIVHASTTSVHLDNRNPATMVQQATTMADTLKDVIDKRGLAVEIRGRRHVKVEGWTTLLAMLGVTPREVTCDEVEPGRYVAVVELVNASDRVIGRASAECARTEHTWKDRDAYALRSMAQTRATGKAARLAFSWIVTLAGYDPTPFEEMPRDNGNGQTAAPPTPKATPKRDATVPAEVELQPVKDGQFQRVVNWEKFLDDDGDLTVVPFGKVFEDGGCEAGRPLTQVSEKRLESMNGYMEKKRDQGKFQGNDGHFLAGIQKEIRRRAGVDAEAAQKEADDGVPF
ncbi:MAG: hypothetical protein GF393_10630 [Armatimonadia bacterium]|nr:hypothetical protein [Armatimonadia bacterium]